MEPGWIVSAVAGVLAGWLGLMIFIDRRGPAPRAGDPHKGVVFFVESLRWVGIPWGIRRFTRGLQRAGYEGQVRYWRWHTSWRGWLVLPALLDQHLLEEQAHRLAAAITRQRTTHPEAPLYVVGYSAGGVVALRAMELLPEDVRVDAAALLAPAISAWRDVQPALTHVRGALICGSSVADFLICGLGVLVFGTGERKHTLSAGLIGLCHTSARHRQVINVRWSPASVRDGHWGGHFFAASAGFTRNRLAPLLLQQPSGEEEWGRLGRAG